MSRENTTDRRIGYLLKRAQVALRAEMDERLARHELTTPQYSALSALDSTPGLSNAELARRSFVTPQTMIRIVAGLEERGLVTRSEHPSHGRILEATLTSDGRRSVRACHELVNGVERQMVNALSEAERRMLARLLQSCADALGSGD
jgi:DNA-binding MarR family transcriptional regulator